ncbi:MULTISPECIES: hypothetical protein [Rhizobium]|jgi:hypothetical protein|uniref:hypothetical protein n=1 Tax=Rhizobium TaxID=379 RepID=UPI0011BDEC80|nr:MULTISPECIES: hypothetical protein [Rhizobium]MBB3287147.1 hypothetical protein [Rhizobium sp. BK252]MBB3401887.1 hypothetical protein [Rhizobium sp. BK289]MBB3414169.1 hypothetical protein [Rhizobium sp. BK284]MBB3482056.1 hypothetical protein [Rhizobium sp. BK347]
MQSGESRSPGQFTENSDILSETALPRWVVRSLADNGITRAKEAAEMTDDQLLMLKGVGIQSVRLIRTALACSPDITASIPDAPTSAPAPSAPKDDGSLGQ